MAEPTGNIVPDGDGTIDGGVIAWISSTSPWWDDIDSGTSSPDDNTGYQSAINFAGISGFFLLGPMPSDFVSMATLSIRIRNAKAAAGDDTYGVKGRIFQSDESTELSDTFVSFLGVGNVQPGFTTKDFLLVNVTPATKAIWDDARVGVEHLFGQTKSPDNNRLVTVEVQVDGTYNTATGVRNLSLTGHGR